MPSAISDHSTKAAENQACLGSGGACRCFQLIRGGVIYEIVALCAYCLYKQADLLQLLWLSCFGWNAACECDSMDLVCFAALEGLADI